MDRLQRLQAHLAPYTEDQGAAGEAAGAVQVVTDALISATGTVEETERHGGHLVAEVLHAHGVKFIFTLVGGHISPILVASKARGVRVIDVRHEVTAVFAADAVARLTGVAGVAAVTAGPGITNTITAVKNAQMAQSPLVLIGGAAATLLKGRGALQDIDQLSLLRPIVKYAATCTSARHIVPTLRRAFQEAMSGVPGPVFVEFPLDVLYPVSEIRASMGMTDRVRRKQVTVADAPRVIVPVEATQRGLTPETYLAQLGPERPVFLHPAKPKPFPFLVSRFMKWQLAHIYANAFGPQDYSPLPIEIPMPREADVRTTAALLKASQRPVLLMGSQAMLFPQHCGDLQAAVQKMGVPAFLGGMARGLLGRNFSHHIRQNRGAALKKADLVILAGAVADFRLDYGRALPRGVKIISINRSPDDVAMNSRLFWTPTLACVADPHTFLVELAGLCDPTPPAAFAPWVAGLKEAETTKEARNLAKRGEEAQGQGRRRGEALANPIDLMYHLEEALPDNSILVADGGDIVATASYILRPRGPLRWLDPGAFGTLGVGGGFALGAKLCRPESEVWLIWGDGSAGYSIAEYDTFMRHNVPVISLIGNDACWTQIEREQIPMFDDDVACPLEYCAYETVAEGYGAAGAVIGPGGNIPEAIAEAQAAAAAGTPFVLNALIGSTDFRDGSLSV